MMIVVLVLNTRLGTGSSCVSCSKCRRIVAKRANLFFPQRVLGRQRLRRDEKY
ncbi:unnamed protein product [Amoebophrya sp. A25]|nr:unnamed protein product [Amoebophrya sp. A25]|eukprot:GSA25T00000695001.1